MAPERFGRHPYDGRVDIYSLGVLLYRMLGGQVPFHSKDLASIAMQHLRSEAPQLTSLNENISPAIEAVVRRAMSKSMEDRPSAVQLAKEFGPRAR